MLARAVLASLVLTTSIAAGGIAMAQSGNSPPGTGGPMAPARPGHVAELEELQAARAKGTREAYDLFLARHPASRYAPQAKAERARIAK
jgi:hypothetical protein